jgi:hypothetical protein
MERRVIFFVGDIHIETILQQQLCALRRIFLVRSKFMPFSSSLGAED